MVLSHKILLSPNNKQKTYFSRAAGVRRFAYNWSLKESELKLSDREWICSQCGCILDRDINASKNLEAWAMSHMADDACGGDVQQVTGLSF